MSKDGCFFVRSIFFRVENFDGFVKVEGIDITSCFDTVTPSLSRGQHDKIRGF